MREEGAAEPYAWVHPHGGYDTPHPKDDPYAWKDPHGRPVRLTDQPVALAGAESVAVAPSEIEAPAVSEPVTAQAETAPAPRRGRRKAAADAPIPEIALADDGVPEPDLADADAVIEAPKRRRVKKSDTTEAAAPADVAETSAKPKRTRKPKAEVAAEPVAEAAEAIAAPVPEPAEVMAAAATPTPVEFLTPAAEVIAEAAPIAPPPPPEPDPAEISAPPEKPKRGWWRLRG